MASCQDCGDPLKLRVLDENIGTVIGDRYEIMSVVARGGIATVYLGRQKLLKRTVAIKLLHSSALKSELYQKRFRREAEASARLDHPNIATVYDFGIADDGRPFLVMAYIDGYSLYELLLEHKCLHWRRALDLFQQISCALSHAHDHGIIHRDLKPANIMVEKAGSAEEVVKLVDFGIAKLLPVNEEPAEKLTQDGDVFGTIFYMSPEQCRGEKPDQRSDIYAFGCVMYETLTGQTTVKGSNMMEILHAQLDDIPQSCRQSRPDLDIPIALDQLILKCLNKTKNDRFQTAAELLSSLNEIG